MDKIKTGKPPPAFFLSHLKIILGKISSDKKYEHVNKLKFNFYGFIIKLVAIICFHFQLLL